MRWLYTLAGILLLPLCLALTRTLGALLAQWFTEPEAGRQLVWAALLAGCASWWLLLCLLPPSGRAYILAHELTHAIWGTLLGARLSRMRVRRDSGHVVLSESNFIVALAPYFFPLYTLLILLGYWISAWFYEPGHTRLLWWWLIGVSVSFHFFYTFKALSCRQRDLHGYGPVFPYVTIYLCNAGWLILLTVLLAGMPLAHWTSRLAHDTAHVNRSLARLAQRGRILTQEFMQ